MMSRVDSGDDGTADVERALVRALWRQQHMGISACSADGTLVMMSPVMQDALGAEFSPTHEAAWASCYHLHDEEGRPLPSAGDPLARALRGEHVTDEVISVRRPGHPVTWLLCNAFPLHEPRGKPLGAAVFVLDVTARAREQQRLNDLRDRLVETVNHEVRTPLALLAGHLELIEGKIPALPEPVQWSLGAMGRATQRLREVVATISELADQSQTRHDGVTR